MIGKGRRTCHVKRGENQEGRKGAFAFAEASAVAKAMADESADRSSVAPALVIAKMAMAARAGVCSLTF